MKRPLIASVIVCATVCALVAPAWATSRARHRTLPTISRTADRIISLADTAEASVTSVHMVGTVAEDRQVVSFILDLGGSDNGAGTFTEDGETIQIVKLGSVLYFSAPASFWVKASGTAAADTYGNRWIELQASDPNYQSFAQFMNPGSLVAQLFTGNTGPLKKGKEKKVGRVKVIPVMTSTTRHRVPISTMYVAASGRPYVVKLVADGSSESGTISFTHYGESFSVVPPPDPINPANPPHTSITPPPPPSTTVPPTTTTTKPPVAKGTKTTTTTSAVVTTTTVAVPTTTTTVASACPRGTASSSVAYSSINSNGQYVISVSGTVTNNFNAPIQGVVVDFTITYTSGTVSYSSPVNGGGAIPAGGSGNWTMTIDSATQPSSIAATHVTFSYGGAYSSCPT